VLCGLGCRCVGGASGGGEEVKLVFVLDDNMPLRSMRHEYFLLARKCEFSLLCPAVWWWSAIVSRQTSQPKNRHGVIVRFKFILVRDFLLRINRDS